MNIRARGVHHLAISTADIKGQIEFFSDVLGAELIALFWMHGVPGGHHAFCRLGDDCSIAFVQLDENKTIEASIGSTHSGTAAGASAPGTMQHVSFKVDSVEELLGMRDRIRSKGINVMGAIDHGFCQSIYFAGPEGLTLELSASTNELVPDAWIDPEVVALCGISELELESYKTPATFESPAQPVAQPAQDPSKPHLDYPKDVYDAIMGMSDEDIAASTSFADPPVKL